MEFVIVLLIYLSMLTEQSVYGSYHCLDKCTCRMNSEGKLTANCTALEYTSIPQPLSHQVDILIMNYNKLDFVKRDAFMRFTSLEAVSLAGNRITSIENGAFIGLGRSNLKRLDLSSNFLSSLPVTEMQRLSHSIEHLSLAFNRLRSFPSDLTLMTKLKELDVSQNLDLTSLPGDPFPASLVTLNIAYTSIRKFTRSGLNLPNLRRLVMSDNLASGAVEFEQGAFDGLTRIEYLDLSRCFCRRLPRDSFVLLTNLDTLLLQTSYLNTLPDFAAKTTPDSGGGVTILPTTETRLDGHDSLILRKRSIDERNQTTVDESFDVANRSTTPSYQWNNPRLSKLDLSFNRRLKLGSMIDSPLFPPSLVSLDVGYTSFRTLNSVALSNLHKLENLDLTSIKLRTIDPGALSQLESLHTLSLSGNSLAVTPELPQSVKELNMTGARFETLSTEFLRHLTNITSLDLGGGNVRHVEDGSLSNLVDLLVLNLTKNGIGKLSEKTLSIGNGTSNSSMLKLDLSHNAISLLTGSTFADLKNLEILFLQNNKLEEITEQTMIGLGKLKLLDLSRNSIVVIAPGGFRDLHGLEELRLQGNELEVIFENQFRSSSKLRTLDLSDNRLLDIHSQIFFSLISIQFQNNNITDFPRFTAPNLTTIDASDNMILYIADSSMRGIPSLMKLHLDGNMDLTFSNYSVLRHVTKLTELRIAGCNLDRFIDVTMPSLKVLNVDRNYINSITDPLEEHLPNIEVIDLSYNNITIVDARIFNGSSTLQSLDLKGNNFHCDCEMQPLAEWIKTQIQHDLVDVVGARAYFCASPSSMYASMFLRAVGELDCSKPSPPPSPSSSSTASFVVEIILGCMTVLAITVAIVTACYCRRRIPSAHSSLSSMPEEQDAPSESVIRIRRRSPVLCCGWLSGRLMGGGRFARSREMSDEEGRDLMSVTPLPTPTDTQPPDEL